MGGKTYLESVRLIDEVYEGGDLQKKVVRDSEVINQGRKVKMFGVEGECVVIGISVPVSGHKFTLYTKNELGEVIPFPLDDLTEFVTSTTTTKEEAEVKHLAELWWKSVVSANEIIKKEKEVGTPKTPQRRNTPATIESPPIPTNRLMQELAMMTARIASLEAQIRMQSDQFQATIRDIMQQMMSHSLELVKAFNKQ